MNMAGFVLSAERWNVLKAIHCTRICADVLHPLYLFTTSRFKSCNVSAMLFTVQSIDPCNIHILFYLIFSVSM